MNNVKYNKRKGIITMRSLLFDLLIILKTILAVPLSIITVFAVAFFVCIAVVIIAISIAIVGILIVFGYFAVLVLAGFYYIRDNFFKKNGESKCLSKM